MYHNAVLRWVVQTPSRPPLELVQIRSVVDQIGGNYRGNHEVHGKSHPHGELISEVIDLSEATRGLEQLDRSDGARSVISFAGGCG